MKFFDTARDRAAAWAAQLKLNELPTWWRRRDKSAERAAVATRAAPFLGELYTWLAWTAWFLEFGFATLWALRANGEIDWTWRVNLGGGDWSFNFAAHVLPAGLTTLAVGLIVAISVTWIPVYNALRGMGRLRRGSVLVVGPLCTAIAILGAIVVQVENVSMDARDAEIVEQRGAEDRAALERRQDRLETQLANMRDRTRTNEYAALAATVGEAEYRARYISAEALAREPSAARRELLQRAVGAAIEADNLERQIGELDQQIASAPVAAELESTTSEVRGGDILGLVQWANDRRVLLIGVTLSIVGLLGLWQAQGLKEAAALLDPSAPVRELHETAPAVHETADPLHNPPDELDLPALADWRAVEDPEFTLRHVMVDEHGRRMKRVAGHWRVEDDRAPAAGRDRRRTPDPAPESPAQEQPAAAPAADIDDLMASLERKAVNIEEHV